MSTMSSIAGVLLALWASGVGVTPRQAHGSQAKKANASRHDALGFIRLNGQRTQVRWTDGDSFSIREGPHRGRSTRLTGYNTLEAYGPVHQWGQWTPAELYELAKGSSAVAAAREWVCTADGEIDGYHRLLVTCEGLAEAMVHSGHALAYAVEGEAVPAAVLAAQQNAIKARRGMWAKGTTFGVVTSVHSTAESSAARPDTYNRVVDTRTGRADTRKHHRRYQTCENVCETTEGQQSCMRYVPFERRYRNRPPCLFVDKQ